jgi:solute carrier family 25 aspartate/glutamate transporter 12/13
MASVKEAVKESLLGSTESPQLSHQARSNFIRHAQKDENGDLFMDKENFIDAVAPKQEDYVSVTRAKVLLQLLT